MQLILSVKNTSPLCFRASRAEDSVETLDYIPGSALLGGLAAAHNRLGRDKKKFEAFFLSGDMRFGNLYPANLKALDDSDFPVCPLPKTALSCKRFSGFRFKDDSDDDEIRHGTVDQLIHWALYRIDEQKGLDAFKKRERCGDVNSNGCTELLDAISGYYRQGYKRDELATTTAKQGIITRAGISRTRGAVLDKILYNRQVMLDNQQFWGAISFAGDEAETLIEQFMVFLEDAEKAGLTYFGNNRSRGLGHVHIPVSDIISSDEPPDGDADQIKQRVIDFNDSLNAEAQKAGISLTAGLYIPFTLQSDAILGDSLTGYETSIEPEYLEREWGLAGFSTIYHSASTRRIMGWNAALGLPKPDDMGIAMGSVFLLYYSGAVDDTFWQKLYNLQKQGIGKRRSEGFGQILIADPFHTEVHSR